MEMVEVDVKLFIKCRMCLDEDGVYQIVPSIRELIKDCFDIDTDPFDGLPQLICKKCKSTLSDYHAIKTTYKLKQLKLKERLVKIKHFTQLNSEIESCNEVNKNGDMPTSPVPVVVSAVTTISPVQSVASVAPVKSVEPEAPVQLGLPVETDIQTALDDSQVINDDTWRRTYNEQYFCKICTKSYQRYASIKRHVKTHKALLKKHKKVFRKYCMVHLNKIDNKENCTGSSHLVVYNTDKIITSKGNSHYHLLYLKKDGSTRQTTSENGKVSDKRPGVFLDSEGEIVKSKKRKTRRLYSGSSTKTTVLEDTVNDITEPGSKNDMHVVNTNSVNDNEASSKKKIDTANTSDLSQREIAKANIANYKAIQNIVTMCQKKYIKKAQSKGESKPPVSESSLKHKVLSLGRKVIHKQGFECTGLLRYMEHKDLEISWQPATRSNKKKNSSFVRIMTKLKSREDLENDDSSWKDLHKITFVSNQASVDDINTDGIDPASITPNDNEESSLQPQPIHGEDQIDHILTNNCDDLNSKNKLLNKTPVANPKQLPKKTMSEIKATTIKTNDTAMLPAENGQTANAEVTDSNLCMPIITSTCSLSTVVEKEKQADPVIEKPAPRIKVKPPSELMSQRALNNQNNSEDIWAFNKTHSSLPYHFNTTVYAGASMYQTQVENQSNDCTIVTSHSTMTGKTNSGSDTHLEYVTLHCSEFPNEKTKFPFQYFKRLLQCHGFELLDINEALPPHFTCLVTCKLLLKQDTIRPLGVWLSLFCSNNSFCFAFKDTNSRKFNPNQLPAFWQWELLKVYKGDVVEKILQNASRISKEVHSYANNFLCLLKSIRCISEP